MAGHVFSLPPSPSLSLSLRSVFPSEESYAEVAYVRTVRPGVHVAVRPSRDSCTFLFPLFSWDLDKTGLSIIELEREHTLRFFEVTLNEMIHPI